MASKPKNPYMINAQSWDKDKVMEYVLGEVETTSFGLQKILDNSPIQLPTRKTLNQWLADTDNGLSDKYARAKELQADYMADEILNIADDSMNDYIMREGKDGDEFAVLNAEHVQRSRLRIDSRKWLMSKLLPKKYGDRIQHANDPDNPMPESILVVHE